LESSKTKWNKKYVESAAGADLTVPEWLGRHIPLFPRGRALDLACGSGRVAIALAREGWKVTAIDISEVGISQAMQFARQQQVEVSWIVADLGQFFLPIHSFDVITVFDYLDRDWLSNQIVQALRPGGMLIYETFTAGQLAQPGNHLRNPAYLLQPGELLAMFSGLRVRSYREVILQDRAVASFVAEKEVVSG